MQIPNLIPSKKKSNKQITQDNPIEAIRSIGSGMRQTATEESKAAVQQAWEQLLGIEISKSKEKSGELKPGEEFDLSAIKDKAHEVTEMGHEFAREIINAGKRATQEDQRESQVKVQEILIELKQLVKSTEEVHVEAQIIAEEQTVSVAGAYKLNFLEQMLSWLRDARENVEDSLAWFQALRSKKASRQYGTMAKKHGTSFTLSNERTASTQTG